MPDYTQQLYDSTVRVAVVLPWLFCNNGFMKLQNLAKPQGIVVFQKLADAMRNGFEVYEKTSNGYLVRTQTAGGWAFALVHETRS